MTQAGHGQTDTSSLAFIEPILINSLNKPSQIFALYIFIHLLLAGMLLNYFYLMYNFLMMPNMSNL